MVRSQAWAFRALAFSVVTMLIAACGGSATPSTAPGVSSNPGSSASTATAATGPQPGGTIYVLTQALQWDQVDPQRVYTGEDLAFFGGLTMRSLISYVYSADPKQGTSITPDMATDLGTATDGGKTWAFTLRDGVTWQDGTDVTCADVKYGVSRTFATSVINQGPTYAIAYLNIPTNADGSSQYPGPYKATAAQQALYDAAVTCDGKTITFHLNAPVADFNYTVTLGFSPVRKSDDTGETYGTVAPWVQATGPYKVDSYTTGNGGKMVLVRNTNWKPASDPIRKAYPDKWEVDFGIDPKIIDQRLMTPSGVDQTAVDYGGVQPENLATIFADSKTANPDYTGRAFSDYDPYARYYWVNVNKVKNVKIRQAMAVALDREAIRLNIGGAFAGDYADGFIKPNIGADYAPTGFYDSFFGKSVPGSGDPALAKQLIADSGQAAPTLVFNFADTPTNQKTAAIVISSLAKAGITVTPAPLEPGKYYSIVFDPKKAGDFGTGGWGADWPNASTVIPPLFTQKGGWDLSQVDDPQFNADVATAQQTLDRTVQEGLWQALNKRATENVFAIPTFFGVAQDLAGTKVGGLYRWPAYGSWPYGQMYVTP
ncbi:MAG TPA: ABC transporter substrate-binding protein [Candidatus Dormibacteraeota bacterium]|nr:ABC transporter substrate-binding protein [Candidatus Dormibacteraeota bacterium]